MRIPEFGTIEILGCGLFTALLLVGAVVLLLRARSGGQIARGVPACDCAALRADLATDQAACTEDLQVLSKRLDSVERSMQERVSNCSDDNLSDGRLNLSARAQALQVLRAGISPETAAVTLGIPVRDVRLLAKVSRLLTSGLPSRN